MPIIRFLIRVVEIVYQLHYNVNVFLKDFSVMSGNDRIAAVVGFELKIRNCIGKQKKSSSILKPVVFFSCLTSLPGARFIAACASFDALSINWVSVMLNPLSSEGLKNE